MHRQKVNRPFPMRSIHPPIYEKSSNWKEYFKESNSIGYHYLNSGVWPFIGGFYIAALVQRKRYKKAERELSKLAEANRQPNKGMDWSFSEWLNGRTGKAEGNILQSWSIGSYIFAYHCVIEKKVPVFSDIK